MIISRSDIIKEVKIVLDMNDQSGSLGIIGDTDQLQTDDIIDECLSVAWKKLAGVAPSSALAEASEHYIPEWDIVSDKYCQRAELDDDVIRVTYAKLASWKRGCVNCVTEEDPIYNQYRSEFAGIRPTKALPGCAIVPGSKEIEIESEDDDDTTYEVVSCNILEAYPNTGDIAGYIKVIREIEEDATNINIPLSLHNAYIFLVASLFYGMISSADNAALMERRFNQELGLDNKPVTPQ